MNPEIDELKELVRHQTALTEDTNRVVHNLRRNARWSMVFRTIYWLIIILLIGGSYYFYIAPYVSRFEQFYQNLQSGTQQAQNEENAFQQFFGGLVQEFQRYFPPAATSTGK